MEHFTPASALLGGVLIGLSAVLLMLTDGRIAGISGITAGVLAPRRGETGWRIAFIVGLIGAPLVLQAVAGPVAPISITSSLPLLIGAGLLVGIGTRLGSGCTSGHGVCGLARFSPRSAAAVVTFLLTAMLTVYLMRHAVGA